jgi:AcrR family transcriptional regulator
MKKRIEDFVEKRKAEIINAVLHLADRFGIRGITTKKIADEVGFVEGAIYKHIKSKDEAFSIILDISETVLKNKFREIEKKSLKPDKALKEWFDYAIDYLTDFPGIYRILFSDELYIENKSIFFKFKYILIYLQEQFEKMIREGKRQKIFREDINPEITAINYLSTINVSFILWNIIDDRKSDLHVLARPIFDEFFHSLIQPKKTS